jgi:hypothetical protein
MAIPNCQTVLNIYNSLIANGQIDGFSANEQIVIHMAGRAAAIGIINFGEAHIPDVENPLARRFTVFIAMFQSGPFFIRSDSDDDWRHAHFWRAQASRYIAELEVFRQQQNAERQAAAHATRQEIARQLLNDEREDSQ